MVHGGYIPLQVFRGGAPLKTCNPIALGAAPGSCTVSRRPSIHPAIIRLSRIMAQAEKTRKIYKQTKCFEKRAYIHYVQIFQTFFKTFLNVFLQLF